MLFKRIISYYKPAINFRNSKLRTSQLRCYSTEPEEILNRYQPRRAVMYVPGSDQRKINKIPSMQADSVILDCEDGVSLNNKEEARQLIKNTLESMNFETTEPIVRINPFSTSFAEQDLQVILRSSILPPTIMLPKVEQASDFESLAESVVTIMGSMNKEKQTAVKVIIFVETAIGLLNLESICRRALELSEMGAPLKLDGVTFGCEDFCANIGIEKSTDARELVYARQKLVLVAKAFQLQAIDMVHVDVKDLEGLKQVSIEGARLGFTGKQVIHPSQVPVVQECFTPSAESVEWASELVKTFEEHQRDGTGAFLFRGLMVDMPILRRAHNILKVARNLEPISYSSSSSSSSQSPSSSAPSSSSSSPSESSSSSSSSSSTQSTEAKKATDNP